MLRERVTAYLDESGIPKTVFCRRLGISTNHLYQWLNHDRNISDELSFKISDYLKKYSIKF